MSDMMDGDSWDETVAENIIEERDVDHPTIFRPREVMSKQEKGVTHRTVGRRDTMIDAYRIAVCLDCKDSCKCGLVHDSYICWDCTRKRLAEAEAAFLDARKAAWYLLEGDGKEWARATWP